MANPVTQMIKKLTLSIVCGALLVFLTSCDQNPNGNTKSNIKLPATVQLQRAFDTLERISKQQNSLSLKLGARLIGATNDFLNEPSESNLESLRASWQVSHEAYLLNQMGLITTPQTKYRAAFNLDAWPIQPGFLDGVEGYPSSGIINDVALDINEASIRGQHGITSSDEVCLGFHSIEYLVFGRQREDFIVDPRSPQNQIIERRRELLRITVAALNTDLLHLSELLIQQFEDTDAAKPYVLLHQWIRSIRQNLQITFRESNFLIDERAGHSPYSQTSREALLVVLNYLQSVTQERIKMMRIFNELDSVAAKNYLIVLDQSITLLNNPEAAETERAKLPLMLAALLHQFKDFETKLSFALEQHPELKSQSGRP